MPAHSHIRHLVSDEIMELLGHIDTFSRICVSAGTLLQFHHFRTQFLRMRDTSVRDSEQYHAAPQILVRINLLISRTSVHDADDPCPFGEQHASFGLAGPTERAKRV